MSSEASTYLAAVAEYRAGRRDKALAEIREWRSGQVWAAGRALRLEGERLVALRAGEKPVRLPVEIDARMVEAAALMHVEAGLLQLQSLAVARAEVQFSAATSLVEWLYGQAAERRRLREALGRALAGPEGLDRALAEALDRALSIELKIERRQLYGVLAATTLAVGFPETALPFAEKAKAAAPPDGEILLLTGCVKESLALQERVRAHEGKARPLREEAESLLREAVRADPDRAEARLRLGGVLLAQGRPREAEPVLQQAAAQARDGPERYLVLLLLGRASERQENPDGGAGFYRRALEVWPESQAARLGLARCLEASAGPSAARPLVGASLLDSRKGAREPDPWWSYPFGPRGLAKAMADRLWREALGRPFGS